MFPFNFYLSKLNLVTRSIIIKRLLSSSPAAATAEGTADGKQTNRNYFPHRLDQRPTNEKSESSNEPPKPPEPPKSFHEKYLRRPLFGYPLKGNSKNILYCSIHNNEFHNLQRSIPKSIKSLLKLLEQCLEFF